MNTLKSTYPNLLKYPDSLAGGTFDSTQGADILNFLYLPPIIEDFTEFSHGLVIVSGSTGSGKTTTANSMVKIINDKDLHNTYKMVVTLEDPIEYHHLNNYAVIVQREHGRDFTSWPDGLKHAARFDPNVIVIGELRDAKAAEFALSLAEVGFLVITTMHSATTDSTIERFINAFPHNEQGKVRERLADNLKAVISQKLLRVDSGQRRVLATEILTVDSGISDAIKSDNLESIRKALDANTLENSASMDTSLTFLSETFKF